MDLDLACVVCNWSRDLWGSLAIGAIGAIGAAAAAAYSASADEQYEDRYSDEVGEETNTPVHPVTGEKLGGNAIPSYEVRLGSYRAQHSAEQEVYLWLLRRADDLYEFWGVDPDAIIGTTAAASKA